MRIRLNSGSKSRWIQYRGLVAAAVVTLATACGPTVSAPKGPGGPESNTQVQPAAEPSTPQPPASAAAAPVFQHAHRQGASNISISADGSTAAVISGDGSVSILDTNTGEVRAARRVWVRSPYGLEVEFSADGSHLLVSGSSGGSGPDFYLWNLQTGAWFHGSVANGYQGIVAISPDGSRVAYGQLAAQQQDASAEGNVTTVQLVEVGSGAPATTITLDFEAVSLTWSPDGSRLLINDGNKLVRLHDSSSGAAIARLELADLSEASFRPDSSAVVVATYDRKVTIVDTSTGAITHSGQLPPGGNITWIGWRAGTDVIAVTSTTDKLQLWDYAASAEPKFTEFAFTGTPSKQVAVPMSSADGTALFSLQTDGAIERWDSTSGAHLNQVAPDEAASNNYAVNASGTVIATSRGLELAFWNADGTKRAAATSQGGEHSVWGVTWLPDSSGLLTWGRAGVELWSSSDGARSTVCGGSGMTTFGPDGTVRYYTGGGLDGGLYLLCEPRTGTTREFEGEVLSATPDGTRYLQRTAGKLDIVDAATGKATVRLAVKSEVYQAQLTSDVAVLYGKKTLIVDATTGKVRHTLGEGINMWGASISADGSKYQYMVDSAAVVVSLADGKQVAQIGSPDQDQYTTFRFAPTGHDYAYAIGTELNWTIGDKPHSATTEHPVSELAYSATGASLVVRTDNQELIILDAASGAVRGQFGGRESRTPVLGNYAVSPDASSLAACTPSGAALVAVDTGTVTPVDNIGLCTGLTFSPNGTLLAIAQGPVTRVVRLADHRSLTLRTLRLAGEVGLQSYPLAYDEMGRFTTVAEALPYLRMRSAGPIATAALTAVQTLEEGHAQLVQQFFGAPQPAPAQP